MRISRSALVIVAFTCLIIPQLVYAQALQPDECDINNGSCILDAHGALSTTPAANHCSPAVNGCYNGVRSLTGTFAAAPIDLPAMFVNNGPIFQRCRYINNGSTKSLFVGVSTPGEWGSFIANGASSNPGLVLEDCSRPLTGLIVYPSSSISNVWSPRTPIAATQPSQTVDELNYFPCRPSGAGGCVVPYAPTWHPTATFNYNPGGAGAPWTETATATFTGQDSDFAVPSWVLTHITYATSTGGQCGSSNGASLSSPPTSGFCNAGAFIDIDTTSPMGPWSWQCNVYQPNPLTAPALANCSATLGAKCGPADGTVVASAPSSGLCSIGAASAVSGSGPWSWTCTQAASTVPCSAAPIPPTGTWTAATGCAGPDLITSYSCQGGNGLCAGPQPPTTTSTNDPSCGPPPTGTWTPASGCVGLDLVTSYSCQGGNGVCVGPQPPTTTSVGDPSCQTPPTGTWTPASACSGLDLVTTYSCQGGNGFCAGPQPSTTTSVGDPSCAPVDGACSAPQGYLGAGIWCSGGCDSGTFYTGGMITWNVGMIGYCILNYACMGVNGGGNVACSVSGDSQ